MSRYFQTLFVSSSLPPTAMTSAVGLPPPSNDEDPTPTSYNPNPPPLSKSARKKQLKQERYAEKKAARKSAEKERRKRDLERRRREWDEKLAGVSEEERLRLLDERKTVRKERMAKRTEERDERFGRLMKAKEEGGQKVVVDMEFGELMEKNEIQSLVHQIMYCYAVNGRCSSPVHLWLTGCTGEIETQLQKTPGYDKWIIEKESRSYVEALQDQKDNLVYLTADADAVLEELSPKDIYIIGGLVDRNRWKGITMKKSQEQGIKSARLPIGSCLKMSSSQVLTVNQVMEILLKFIETKDWKTAFFLVIPQRKISEADAENADSAAVEVDSVDEEEYIAEGGDRKKKKKKEI